MTKRRWWLAGGAVVLAATATAVALSLAFSGRSSAEKPSHLGYAALWRETRVGESKAVVLRRWPKNPYEHYSDNLKEDCYEWKGTNLYNLCFKDGVLRLKTLF